MSSIIRNILRKIAKSYIYNNHKKNNFPQMAVFSNDYIGHKVIIDGWYEKRFLEQLTKVVLPYIRKNTIALDIGANIGNHSLWFADYFERVHSFEPNSRTFRLLEANTMFSKNIIIHNVGCSNEPASNQLAIIPKNNIGGTRLYSSYANTPLSTDYSESEKTYFDLVRLDDYLPNDLHCKVGLIKCDVEWYEEQVFQGAENIILSSKPIIAFEPNRFENVQKNLIDFGYKYFYGISRFHSISKIKRINKFIPIISKDDLNSIYKEVVLASFTKINVN